MRPGEVIVILGRRGTGKTTRMVDLGKSAILEAARRRPIVERWKRWLGLEEKRPVIVTLYDPRGQIDGTPLFRRLVPSGDLALQVRVVLDIEGVARSLPGTEVLLLDEVDLICGPSAGRDNPVLWAANYGRHSGLMLICTARRPARIHRDLTALADRIILYRLTEPRDLAYVREYCGAEMADRVARLGSHESVTWQG